MRYPLSSPHSLSLAAQEAAIETFRSGRYTMGAQVQAFERQFAAHVGSKHAVMVNSGSSANLLAVEAMLRPSQGEARWNVGDEVLVPALAWSTTVWPLVQLGLVPVFVDCDPTTLAMDLGHAKWMLSVKTVGVMLIHVMGYPAPVQAFEAFCEAAGLDLIEDCCEAFGTVTDRSVGRTGVLGTFSHYFSHQLTTVEGGTIITDDDLIADDLRSMRAHGWIRNRQDREQWSEGDIDARFLFASTGYNVRPMEMQGAMGCVQLTDVGASLDARMEAIRQIVPVLDTIEGLETLPESSHYPLMNLPILVHERSPFTRDQVVAACEAAGIETRPLLAGNLLKHPAMRGLPHRRASEYPVADRLFRQAFMMGCWGDAETAVACLEQACRTLKAAA